MKTSEIIEQLQAQLDTLSKILEVALDKGQEKKVIKILERQDKFFERQDKIITALENATKK